MLFSTLLLSVHLIFCFENWKLIKKVIGRGIGQGESAGELGGFPTRL